MEISFFTFLTAYKGQRFQIKIKYGQYNVSRMKRIQKKKHNSIDFHFVECQREKLMKKIPFHEEGKQLSGFIICGESFEVVTCNMARIALNISTHMKKI